MRYCVGHTNCSNGFVFTITFAKLELTFFDFRTPVKGLVCILVSISYIGKFRRCLKITKTINFTLASF